MEPEELYREMDVCEPYGTRELAEKADIARRTALNYLDNLADEGRIRKKKIDERRVVWMRTD